MALVMDSVLVAGLARELSSRYAGARLRALRMDRGRRALVLLFREGTLGLRLVPEAGTVTWSDPLEPAPGDRPLAARLRSASALPDDRVLILSLSRVRGSPARVEVIVEWIANRWNAVVTEGEERIVRHVLIERSSERSARSGHPWVAPAPSPREGVHGDVTSERWRALLLPVPPEHRRRTLLTGLAWTSPLNAPALLGAAADAPVETADAPASTTTDVGGGEAERALDDGFRIWQALAAVARGTAAAQPVLLSTGDGAQPYPLALPGTARTEGEPTPSLLDAFNRAAALVPEAPPTIPAELIDTLEERVVRAWARADALRHELVEAADPATLRATADLLLARLAEVGSGVERQRLTDFAGTTVEIELDPARSPQENAAVYYERAARAERARARLPELIAEAERDARRVEHLVEGARAGRVGEDALRAELPARQEASGGPGAPALPYRVYRSSGGLEIRVGKGARHNDDLTFHHSAPDDVWMHARHAAGAHVVLRWKGDANPPSRDLAEAASLAALHSKARTSGSVPVDWTRRKYVRKPRRSPPGQVTVERARTVFATPDPVLEERLRT